MLSQCRRKSEGNADGLYSSCASSEAVLTAWFKKSYGECSVCEHVASNRHMESYIVFGVLHVPALDLRAFISEVDSIPVPRLGRIREAAGLSHCRALRRS